MTRFLKDTTSLGHAARAALFVLTLSAPALCQTTLTPYPAETRLTGPRFGVTVLGDGVIRKLKAEDNITVGHMVTQFGWQVERQFYSVKDGPSAVTEAVVLLGGLERGLAIPSASWIVGVRAHNGTEFGVGPNATPAGLALVLTAGRTFHTGLLNVPVNVAVVPSKDGVRVSVLTGFNLRRR